MKTKMKTRKKVEIAEKLFDLQELEDQLNRSHDETKKHYESVIDIMHRRIDHVELNIKEQNLKHDLAIEILQDKSDTNLSWVKKLKGLLVRLGLWKKGKGLK